MNAKEMFQVGDRVVYFRTHGSTRHIQDVGVVTVVNRKSCRVQLRDENTERTISIYNIAAVPPVPLKKNGLYADRHKVLK